MIGDYLAYVSAVVQDVEGVASILESEFQLPRSDLTVGSSGRRAPVFSVGQTGLALFEMGDEFVGGAERRGVHHLAVAVDGMVSAAMEAGSLGVPSRSAGPEWGLGGAQRMLLDPQATGGVIVYLSERLNLPSGDAGQVERIDHIGVASEDNNLAVEVFARRLGWAVESTQTDTEISQPFESFTSDKYGVTYRAGQPRVVGGVRVAFVTIGDCDLEFLQNIDPDSSASVEHGRPGKHQPGPRRNHPFHRVPRARSAPLGPQGEGHQRTADTVGKRRPDVDRPCRPPGQPPRSNRLRPPRQPRRPAGALGATRGGVTGRAWLILFLIVGLRTWEARYGRNQNSDWQTGATPGKGDGKSRISTPSPPLTGYRVRVATTLNLPWPSGTLNV